MGRNHRLSFAAIGALLALWTLHGTGCARTQTEDKRAAFRRRILQAQDLEKDRRARIEQTRLVSDQGDLIASNEKMAGIVLPRGFERSFTFQYAWWYDGPLPMDKLERYFTSTLTAAGMERPDLVSVTYKVARTKTEPEGTTAMVRIYPVPGRTDFSRIQIEAPQPLPDHKLSQAEVNAELMARMRE